jgi:hypothetical protein
MVFSSSKMLPPGRPINTYTSYGFDNAEVTHLLTVHEFGHSFVNPHLNELKIYCPGYGTLYSCFAKSAWSLLI